MVACALDKRKVKSLLEYQFMKICITRKDIDKCISERIGWSNPCPITMVLRRRFPGKYVLVNGMHILAGEEYKVSKKLAKFIVDWDRKREVKPITFRMWLVKGWKYKLKIWWKKLPFVKYIVNHIDRCEVKRYCKKVNEENKKRREEKIKYEYNT